MARFVLQPCKLRVDQLVPVKGAEEIEFSWGELVAKLAPSRDLRALKTLYHAQPGAFLGLVRDRNDPKKLVNFCFVAQDRGGNIAGILYKDPSFAGRFVEAYQVVQLDKGRRILESSGTVPYPTTQGMPK
jgi:hypothetical protein